MNRRELTLAILAAADGQAFTPVQLQKAAFLVTRNLPGIVDHGAPFDFVPYDYGPFDLAVYSEAEALETEGRAHIRRMSPRWRTYAASADGLAAGRQFLDALPAEQRDYIRQVAAWVRGLDFQTLVKSIYAAYPDTRANSIFQG